MRYLPWLAAGLCLLLTVGCGDDTAVGPGNGAGPDGRLYVLNQGDNTMYIYDSKTLNRVDSIDTRVHRPHYIEFAPDGQYYYIVTLGTPGSLAKFQAATNAFVDSVTMPGAVQPSAIAITADSRYGYVCNFSSANELTRILKYDLNTLQLVDSMQAGATTHDVKITSDGRIVVATNRNTDNITLVYTDADTVAFVNIDPDSAYAPGRHKYGPFGVAIDHRDSLAFIACADAQQIRVLDIAQRRIVDSIDVPVSSSGFIYGPTLMAVSPDNDVVFVTTREGNSVVAVRVSTRQAVADIPLSTRAPFGITISSDGSRVYAAAVGDPFAHGRVFVIDGSSLRKVDSLDVGTESFGLTWHR